MELSNYKVEIIGGRHMGDPNSPPVSNGWGSSSSLFSRPWTSWSNFGTAPSSDDKSYVEMRDGEPYKIHLRNDHSTRCHAKITIDGKPVGTWILKPWSKVSLERPVDIPKKFTFYKVSSQGGQEAGLVRGDSNNGLISVEFIPEHEYVELRRPTNFFESDLKRGGWKNCCDSNDNDSMLLDDDSLGGGFFGERSNPGWGGESGEVHDQFHCLSSGQGSRKSGGRTANFRGGDRGCDRGGIQSLSSYESGGTGLKGKSDQDFRISNERLDLDHTKKVTINLRLIAKKEVDYDRITPLGQVTVPSVPISNPVPRPFF